MTVNPDMSEQELRLHLGELTAQEARTARAAIRWANAVQAPVIAAAKALDRSEGWDRVAYCRAGAEASPDKSLASELQSLLTAHAVLLRTLRDAGE